MARSGRQRGEAFERRVVAALETRLPGLAHQRWIAFEDANGKGLAEPDAYLVRPQGVLIFEIKLTACRYGHEQLQGLYGPLLSQLFSRPVRCLQIARALHAEHPGPLIDSLDEFVADESITIGTLHLPDVRFL